MNNTQTTILNLIKASLNPAANQGSIDIQDYDALLQELNAQSIVGIPGEFIVSSDSTPESEKQQWTNIVYSQVAEWTKLMEAQEKLIKLLNDNNIPLAIIKGSAAAMYYPKPEYRSMGDIDFFVKAEDFEKAHDLLLKSDYKYVKDEDYAKLQKEKDEYHHVEFKKRGITFELHKRMSETVQGNEMDHRVDQMIMDGMNHIQMGRVGQYEFPMFEKKLNGLIILRHIIQHLGETKPIGLRHVIDWMMFVRENVDDAFWDSEYADYLDAVNLKDAAITFARMSQIYLGLDETIAWCKKANDQLCKDWMEQILASGNFGRKNKKQEEGANVFYRNKNIFAMFKSLQGLGLKHWEPARKHIILRPFAWAYQICRYAKKGLGRKNPVRSLKTDMAKSKSKKELMDRLNIN